MSFKRQEGNSTLLYILGPVGGARRKSQTKRAFRFSLLPLLIVLDIVSSESDPARCDLSALMQTRGGGRSHNGVP